MALQAFILVLTNRTEDSDTLPSSRDIVWTLLSAFETAYGKDDDRKPGANCWPVSIEQLGVDHPDGVCRGCEEPCESGRLFCDECSMEIVEATAEDEDG